MDKAAGRNNEARLRWDFCRWHPMDSLRRFTPCKKKLLLPDPIKKEAFIFPLGL